MDTEDDYEYAYSDASEDEYMGTDDDETMDPALDKPSSDNPNAAPTCSPVSLGGGTYT